MSGHSRRTFADYKAEVLHALGNPDESELTVSPGAIVNDALEAIATMHEWRWKQTGEVRLSLTKDQDYVELPADFGTMIAVEFDRSWTGYFEATTWETLLWLRQQPIRSWHSGYMYVIDIGQTESGEEDAGLSLPVMHLYPTPAEDDTDAIRLAYIRHLRRLQNETDRPQWPAYMDRPCSLLSWAMATVDYDDTAAAHYEQQFQRLVNDGMKHDGLVPGSFGMGRSGLYEERTTPFGYPDQGIPNPSSK